MDYTPEFVAGQYRLGGRAIAELRGDVLSKRVVGSRHMLRQPRQAWALDNAVLVDAERRGALTVEVVDTETQKRYRAAIALFHSAGFTVDRGHGAQRALALVHWQTADAQETAPAVPAQLAFGWW